MALCWLISRIAQDCLLKRKIPSRVLLTPTEALLAVQTEALLAALKEALLPLLGFPMDARILI